MDERSKSNYLRLKNQQFALVMDQSKRPIFYLAWAYFDAETEQNYLDQEHACLRVDNWCNGDRLWILDCIAPLGHMRQMNKMALANLIRQPMRP